MASGRRARSAAMQGGTSIDVEQSPALLAGALSGSVLPPFPTDMDVDPDDTLGFDPHNTPVEKTDADFFNGDSRQTAVSPPPAPLQVHTPLVLAHRTCSHAVAPAADFEDDFDDEDV